MTYIKVNETQSLPCWKLIRLREEGHTHEQFSKKAVHIKCHMNGRDNEQVESRWTDVWDGQKGLQNLLGA